MKKPVPKIIFIVDDDVGHVNVCERVLKNAGYLVTTATNGADALKTLAHSTVDLLLVDIFMPETDGFEVIQSVRRRSPGVVIVAMSGGGVATRAEDVLGSAAKLGARAILQKPFTAEELTNTVAAAIGPR